MVAKLRCLQHREASLLAHAALAFVLRRQTFRGMAPQALPAAFYVRAMEAAVAAVESTDDHLILTQTCGQLYVARQLAEAQGTGLPRVRGTERR